MTLASLNPVYQIGNMLYLSLSKSFTMARYGSSSKYGSRRLVSICAWARKKGAKIPTWYHLTSISGPGFPKNPPTSAITHQDGIKKGWYRGTHTPQTSFQQSHSQAPS